MVLLEKWCGIRIPVENLSLFRGLEHIQQFLQDPFALRGVVALNSLDQARIEVMVEDLRADLVEGRLDSLDLADDIDAVFTLLDHALDSTQVSFCDLKAANGFLVVVHTHSLSGYPTPPGGVLGLIYTILTGFVKTQRGKSEQRMASSEW